MGQPLFVESRSPVSGLQLAARKGACRSECVHIAFRADAVMFSGVSRSGSMTSL